MKIKIHYQPKILIWDTGIESVLPLGLSLHPHPQEWEQILWSFQVELTKQNSGSCICPSFLEDSKVVRGCMTVPPSLTKFRMHKQSSSLWELAHSKIKLSKPSIQSIYIFLMRDKTRIYREKESKKALKKEKNLFQPYVCNPQSGNLTTFEKIFVTLHVPHPAQKATYASACFTQQHLTLSYLL